MNAVSLAQSSLALSLATFNEYLQLRPAVEEAERCIQPLQRILDDPALANACQNNATQPVQVALFNLQHAAETVTERAQKIRSKTRWRLIVFSATYSAQLLKALPGLHARISELQLLLAADMNASVRGIQQQSNDIQRLHRAAISRLERMEADASISNDRVCHELCEALVDAEDGGNAAEAETIRQVLAFLAGSPSTIAPWQVQEIFPDLENQISAAQIDKSQAEAELLEQFAKYLSLQGAPVPTAPAPSAAAAEDPGDENLKSSLTCVICHDIYTDPVRHRHRHAHICKCA